MNSFFIYISVKPVGERSNFKKIHPKLENFTTQNSIEISWAPLEKENKRLLQSTVMNSFFIYIGVKPTVFQLLYGL